MIEFVGITTSAQGDGVLKLLYPADTVLLLNDAGKLGVYPMGQIDDQGKPKGIPAENLLTFATYASAVEWLSTSTK